MPIQISELRLSFVWVESFLALLSSRKSSAPMAFMAQKEKYKAKFQQAQAGTGDLEPPWVPSRGRHYNHFWYHYLKNTMPEMVDGERAWKKLVPLRPYLQAKLKAPWLPGRIGLAGFYYPHAVTVETRVVIQADLSLAELVDKVNDVRAKRYVETQPNGSQREYLLSELAAEALDAMREHMLGAGAPPGERASEPFVVATVIRGSGVDARLPNEPNGEAHRALEVFSSWQEKTPNFVANDLQKSTLKAGNPAAGHVAYKLKRGRATWFPDWFTRSEKLYKMSCYHNNLTIASLHTESLLALIRRVKSYLERGALMPLALEELVFFAARELGLLYHGVDDTYRSCSVCAQIVDSELMDLINLARDRNEMPRLEPQAALCLAAA